jgi:ABC-type uncharacterized transport system substrate-binding protein
MDRKFLCAVLVVLLFVFCAFAEAQQQKKIPRIAYLSAASGSSQVTQLGAFRQGLRELGYSEGKNILIEERYAEEKLDRLSEFAAELVRLKADVIVTGGPTVTRFVKAATSTIPIVMAFDIDPVGSGFVASLAHPGGNITGLSSLGPELSGKQLELLKEIVPKLSRVAILGNSTQPGNAPSLRETEVAAREFKVQLQLSDVLKPKDIETAFQAAAKAHADAVLILGNPFLGAHRKQILELAVRNRLPVIYPQSEWVEEGGLIAYAASRTDLSRRTAVYVDKILKGAKPADLPVEQPKKFEFIINLKAAKQIGLIIPPNVLARADRVIR